MAEAWSGSKLVEKYLEFFKAKGHAIIPSASLIPENDPTVLFTAAGMHPLVPFLLGQPHPLGKRLANNQKCLRTDDIEQVGDASHHTFFFMLGNWSLGDYFKKEAIEMSWEFLTSPQWLGLEKNRLSVTVFAGDADASRDDYSAGVWASLGVPTERIYYNPKKDNWWGPAGSTGPCGPDTEMFYDTLKPKCGPNCKPGCGCGKYFEIWNDVFMEYGKTADGKYEKLKQQNVDTGMGLERTLAVLQGKDNDYETELFKPVMDGLRKMSKKQDATSQRIVADHLRSAVFVLGDDRAVTPSNVEQGYIVRRLIRRSIRHARLLGIEGKFCKTIAQSIVAIYGKEWPELERNKERVYAELEREEERFSSALEHGVKEFNSLVAQNNTVTGKDAFLLYQSFGFPLEMTIELAKERGLTVDKKVFEQEFERHRQLSREGAGQRFKSGLADQSEATVALHTATHLLHAALRKVLGLEVKQMGSNITPERLRFDFSWPQKVAPEQLKQAEKLVNDAIGRSLKVTREEMPLEQAKAGGALAFFGDKYSPEKVSVYTVGDFSKEVCAGPHVQTLEGMGRFKIQKEEAVAAGVRRIKAVLEK
ncbi:MAG: alanine--tRNA ligase [Candidatus Micrarchaeota archaeon]|nr:alanine--tRNA ligase [Candidatus Micrarchaeota archaeon]